MRLRVSLPTSHPGVPTAGTRDSLKQCFKGHPLPFTADTGPGFPAQLRAGGGGRTAPHRRDPGFPEETERILKMGSGARKAGLLGQARKTLEKEMATHPSILA